MFKNLIKWSSQYSNLPWRQKRTLYTTLVSEIMLQQTTVGTVLNHFDRFLKEYPSLKSLANATEEELTISWKGLGYYRRARNLKKACEFIQKEHKGNIPLDYDTLVKIPGIGDYTASALLSIGDNQNVFAIDANIERVMARLFAIDLPKGKDLNRKIKEIEKDPKIQKEIKKVGGRDLNEALMDLGRNYCKARTTYCELCPLSENCLAFKEKKSLSYPKNTLEKKIKKMHELHLLRVIVKKKNDILVYEKKKGEWLEGQNEVPTFIIHTEDESLKQYPHVLKKFSKLPTYKTGITKYKITNHVLEIDEKEWKKTFLKMFSIETKFCDPKDKKSNLSTASLKALRLE